MGTPYTSQVRVERFIALGRALLALCALVAVQIDPTEPVRHNWVTDALLFAFVGYAVAILLAVWRFGNRWPALPLVSHAVDLVIFALLMRFTQGPASPFFVFFVFALVCATLRWQLKGTLYTAAIALVTVVVLAFYPRYLLDSPTFDLNRFIIRISYLGVVTALLGYLGAHEQRLRSELARLAGRSWSVPDNAPDLVRSILEHGASVLVAPRMLLLWEERDEPWLHTALWSEGECRYTREAPGTFGTVVASPLADRDFLCRDLLDPSPTVLYAAESGWASWRGEPLSPELSRRFSLRAVLALAFRGKDVEGRIFVLDRVKMDSDDLVLGAIVARQTASQLDQFYLLKQLQQTAAMEERIRLARDLHDGLLQSLTATALQLQTVRGMMGRDTEAARERLGDVQQTIVEEQRNLRAHIRQLTPFCTGANEAEQDLAGRLGELARRIERQWGPRVALDLRLGGAEVPAELSRQVYFVVAEALFNAVRHAHASTVRVELSVAEEALRIVVADDGGGFAFRGRYDGDALAVLNLGPAMLRERIASLGGGLALESGGGGARLEMTLPLPDKGV